MSAPRSAARHAWFLLVALCASALLVASPAQAAGTPDLQLSGGPATTVLYGDPVPVSLKASLPAGAPKGYNLAYRAVLPAGTRYVGGSAGAVVGEPRVITNAGVTTLIWDNVSDLVANASHTLDFEVAYNDTTGAATPKFDAGDPITIEAGAYIALDPRDVADFDAAGVPVGPNGGSTTGTYDGFATITGAARTTTLSAIQITKSEPHPEGEIPRGLHDHQTVYTLKTENNGIRPTTNLVVEDYLPAGLEFLGCATTVDHTTNAPTNPGSTEEYPGSGGITVAHPTAAEDCRQPDLVETVSLDPDGPTGPLPAGVYTHVTWTGLGDLQPGEVRTLTYAAAIPIRENTTTWSGTEPGSTGDQTANLDNNSGPETYDEQPLLNGAVATGDYQSQVDGSRRVSDQRTLLRTAEDIAIQKSNDKGSLEQGDITKWTIDVQASEYRSVDDVIVRDTVPDGLCPLGTTNLTNTPSSADAECDPVAGKLPSAPYTSVDEQGNGTFAIVWDKTTMPSLAHLKPSETRQITFYTRTRENYQENFANATPVLSKDAVTNNVSLTGVDWVRCTSTPNDCVGANNGTKVDHDETDGVIDNDVSGSGKVASGPSILKQVAAKLPASGDCNDLVAADYGKSAPDYGPGDSVCWKVRLDFPAKLNTTSQDVFDVLPPGLTYVAGSSQTTTNNDLPVGPIDATQSGILRWAIGNANDVNHGGLTFEVTFKTTVGSPLGHASGDISGNLQKFSYTNTPGAAFTLRDRTDFEWKVPTLKLNKGVEQLNSGGLFSPTLDDRTVVGGDVVQYRLDVTNTGKADASDWRVWDKLPAGIVCADLVPGSISDGGTCNASENRIEWSLTSDIGWAGSTALPTPPTSRKVTYRVKIPVGVAPDRMFINNAAVVEYGYESNTGVRYPLIPANVIVKDPALPAPNAPIAEDPSKVVTPAATIVKTRTTSVNEPENAVADRATIGETITYTVTTTIPAGTTLYDTPKVTDVLDARNALVPGSLSGKLNGVDLPTAGITAVESGNTVSAVFPVSYTNAPGSGADILVLTFQAKVLDVASNTRGADLPNRASLTFDTETNAPITKSSATVNTRIVEPKTLIAKSHTPSGTVSPGQIIDFTVTTSAQSGTNFSTAHDVIVVDTLPAGTDPVDGSGNPIPDGGAVPTSGGIWNATTRTITWNTTTTPALSAIAPGASVQLKYRAKLESAPISGAEYVNQVGDTIKSLDPSVGGVRTATSPTSPQANDYKASTTDKIAVVLPSVTKSVTPEKVTIGDKVTWTVRATLPADVRYFDATVIDTVPDGFDVDSYGAITCVSGCLPGDPTVTSFPVTGTTTRQAAWFLGDLAPSAAPRVYDLVLKGHVRDTYKAAGTPPVLDAQTLINSVVVKTNRTNVLTNPTTVPGTYSDTTAPATAQNKVVEPKFTITKTADKGPNVEGGDVVTYTVKAKNTGTAPAYDLVVDDQPDAELTDVQLSSGVSTTLNTDGWTAGDPDLRWVVAGPVAPDETVTFTYTAKVKPGAQLVAGAEIKNIAKVTEFYGVPKATRDLTPPWQFRKYDGPEAQVVLAARVPNLTIVKTPDNALATAGAASSFTIVVRNTDTFATAHDVVVHDVLPAGISYTPGTATASPVAGFSETGAAGQTIDWKVTTLAPGASVTITVPVKLAANLDPDTLLTNTASTHANEVPTDKTDTGSLKVRTEADLRVTKTADQSPLIPGTNVVYTLVVRNDGPSDARNAKLTDTLPSYLTYVSDDSADCSAAGQSFTCDFGTLAPGATRTIKVTAKVDPARTSPVTNAADVTTTTPNDPTPNNHSQVTTPVKPTADVSITKAASGSVFQGGDTVTYTLRAHNDGPSTATNVVIDDEIPGDLELVSTTPGAPTCTIVAAHVTCAVGTLAPGADSVVTITTKAKGTAPSPDASGEGHKITVGKAEQSQSLDAGETRTYDVTCEAGGIASDGSVEVMHVDQGTGTSADVEVLEARSVAAGTYRFTVRNNATGRAQVKLFVTCLPHDTDAGPSHSHGIDVGALQTLTTGTLPVGRHTFTIPTTFAHRATAPGLEVLSGSARLVGGEPDGTGWKFTVEVLQPAKVNLSIRPLSNYTLAGGNPLHQHGFDFQHIVRKVTIQPGESVERVSCPVGYKGITATYDLPAGVISLGNEPQPINRDFRLLNTTGAPIEVTLDLECISIDTQDPVEVVQVTNAATVASATFDPFTGNNQDATTIGVERVPGSADPGPAPAPRPTAPVDTAPVAPADPAPATPAAPASPATPVVPATPKPALRFGTFTLAPTATTATVPVTCSGTATCRGTVTVTAQVPSTLRAKGAAKTRKVVLGKATYLVKAGKTTAVKVKIAKRYRSLLSTRKVRSVSVTSGKASAKKTVVVAKQAPKATRG